MAYVGVFKKVIAPAVAGEKLLAIVRLIRGPTRCAKNTLNPEAGFSELHQVFCILHSISRGETWEEYVLLQSLKLQIWHHPGTT